MSFGLRNAAQTFQRFMDEILRGLDFCFAYVDDILVFSRSHEDHERHLGAIFGRLQTYWILINPAKCVFRASEVTFLGYRCLLRDPDHWRIEWPIFRTASILRPRVSSVASWAC
jgi:hypothetical protein